jgi:hypothetical protein
MHKEVLTQKQLNLLPLLKVFSKNFGLVGETAIALYLGHRKSIDFDLVSLKEFDNLKIRKEILKFKKPFKVIIDQKGEYSIVIDGVKITFLHYPFKIKFSRNFENIIKLPDLLTLSAMKAYALGRRAKWKDYVDLYFIMKYYRGIKKVIKKAKNIFGNEFNEKMFRAELAYFKDIDFSEKIIYLKGFKTKDEEIKRALINFSLQK